ncbi:hypothetical protein BG004_007315 [Podila humilis]|nr:hypothetical protein BG004_007315 [Podila humilis]
MSIRLVSSARNLREQFKGNGGTNLTASSGASIFTTNSGLNNPRTADPSSASVISRQDTLLRSTSSGNLRRSKSQQKKNLLSKVFTDEANANYEGVDLSMELTLLIVKRCVKEIRERGLTTKGILRQVQMGQSPKVTMDVIRLILDDDTNTELSPLRQVDIHLIAHAMKWAIRYSEETLVTYSDYQALFIEQDRSFSRLVHDLPPSNRAILLELFSLCADVTSLHHVNGMKLSAVAKNLSLCIMAEPESEFKFKTFDASLQQRNMWGAACEDLLRAFLVIKATHDLAKIEQEDEVDENRYVDNITRVVKSARQRSNENGAMPNVSVPTSASSAGWPAAMTPSGYGRPVNGYFDQIPTPRSASPLSQQSSSLSRSHSLAKSNSTKSRPISPAPFGEDRFEYEELMQDNSHLARLRHTNRHSRSLRPAEMDRRKSSAGMESLYMLPVDSSASMDGYESEPEVSHTNVIPDFADGLGWDFSKIANLQQVGDPPSLTRSDDSNEKNGVNRSNSSSSNGSSSSKGGAPHNISPRTMRDYSKQSTPRVRQLQDQYLSDYNPHTLQRAHSQQDMASSYRDSDPSTSPPPPSIYRSSTNVGKTFVVGKNSPSTSPNRSKRNSVLRRSVSLDPHSMQQRLQKKSTDLRQDTLIRDLAVQEGFSPFSPSFSLESSPQDLERPTIPTRNASQGLGRSMSKTAAVGGKLEISVGKLPAGTSSELTPVSNPPSITSMTSPHPQLPMAHDTNQSARTFEVVSRPKDIEVSVLFTPITPVSPKADMRSKFQESFSDRPMSPPQGYANGNKVQHSRSPTAGSSSSKGSSPRQRKAANPSAPSPKGNSIEPQQQQQGLVSSGASSLSVSSSNPPEGKAKKSGFIRALSHKLRSKQSDDQLRPVRINNQVVGSAAVPPSVSIQPPRLELSFLGDLGNQASTSTYRPDTATAGTHPLDDGLPPASAPASFALNGAGLALSDSESGTIQSWKQMAQNSLPVPAPGSGELGPSGQETLPSPGYLGTRRASGTLFGAGNVAHREQRRRSKQFTVGTPVSRLSPLAQPQHSPKADGNASSPRSAAMRPSHLRKETRTSSDSSYTTDEDSVSKSSVGGSIDSQATLNEPSLTSSQATANSPSSAQKPRGGDREYRFSTATLLKDGKLYYQLQWDAFSEIGFKSDFFHQPEQYLSGLHQKRMSRAVMGSSPLGSGATATASPSQANRPGQLPLGHVLQAQDMGPSPEQRLAAMKAARESFMALVKDPKALAALKAGSTDGIGQATIIGTGSFPIGSAQPVLQAPPPNLNWNTTPSSPLATRVSPKTLDNIPKNPYPSPAQSPGSNSNQAKTQYKQQQTLVAAPLSTSHNASTRLQKNMSANFLPASSQGPAAALAALSGNKGAGSNSGSTVAGAGGASLSSSSSTKPDSGPVSGGGSVAPVDKAPKKMNRLFGSKFKTSPKKGHRVSVQINTINNSINTGKVVDNSKKRQQHLPRGVVRQDTMTKTEESLDEVFPWMTVEHMTGQESGWVMLEPVQDGAVGWVKIDKLEEEMAKYAKVEQRKQQQHA